MDIKVEYKDNAGQVTNFDQHISKLALIKHMAFAGQRYASTPNKLFRVLGMGVHYAPYLQDIGRNNHFSEPPIALSDPTEKSQFSNIAGKAIADFLSKRISGAVFTTNYEAAMRLKGLSINGTRPDLIAYKDDGYCFTLEAKGYSKRNVEDYEMDKHKAQSVSPYPQLPVNFSVASVTYNMYDEIKCKYYDPEGDNNGADISLFRDLTRQHYSNLLQFIKGEYQDFFELDKSLQQYYRVRINWRLFEEYYYFYFHHFFHHNDFNLILPSNIEQLSKEGLREGFETIDDDNIYIDRDGVGIEIR